MEGISNVVLNTHARLQISHPKRFLSLLHYASQCAFGDGVCWLLIWQFFSLFAQFKTTAKSHKNYVSCIHFPIWPYPPKIMKKLYFILVNCMGWQVWKLQLKKKRKKIVWLLIERLNEARRWQYLHISHLFSSVQFSSAQEGVYVLRKAHMCSPHLSAVFPTLSLNGIQASLHLQQLASSVQFSIKHWPFFFICFSVLWPISLQLPLHVNVNHGGWLICCSLVLVS